MPSKKRVIRARHCTDCHHTRLVRRTLRVVRLCNFILFNTHTRTQQVVLFLGIHKPHATGETRGEEMGKAKTMATVQESNACSVSSSTSEARGIFC